MKTLLIGFLAFSMWSSIATYIYVCNIKGLCNESLSLKNDEDIAKKTISINSEVKATEAVQITIPQNLVIYFEYDKSEFTTTDKTDQYVKEADAYLNLNPQARLTIMGHTDAIGTEEYNQALGYRRAQRIHEYFRSKGTPENKIIIESRGENEPVGDNSTKTGRENNRRTELKITQ